MVIAALIGWFFHFISVENKMLNNDIKKDSIVNISSAPTEYLSLFKPTEKLMLETTRTSKTRNPISKFSLDRLFRISVCKINIDNLPLDSIIVETNNNKSSDVGVSYEFLDAFKQYDITYKCGVQKKASAIMLNLSGAPIEVIAKNDTLAYYYSKVVSFSIKYSQNESDDIYGSIKTDSTERIPIEIMFIKRNRKFYMALLSPKDLNTPIVPGMLKTLIN